MLISIGAIGGINVAGPMISFTTRPHCTDNLPNVSASLTECLVMESLESASILHNWIEVPSSKQSPIISREHIEEGRHYPKMNGREVFRNAVVRFPQVIGEALDKNNLTMDDVTLVIPHQANLRITQSVAKRLGVGMDVMYSNIQKYGNTTGASIPIALAEAYNEGKFKSGDIIVLAAFGSGFTWASAAIKW